MTELPTPADYAETNPYPPLTVADLIAAVGETEAAYIAYWTPERLACKVCGEPVLDHMACPWNHSVCLGCCGHQDH